MIKKLLLLLLIAPMIGNSQIGNIFPTEIAEIIYIQDGSYYDVPQGYVFQAVIGGNEGVSLYIKNSNEYSYVTDVVRSLIPSGYSVKGGGGFFSGVLLDLSNSDFNLIFEVDTDFESSLNLSVPANKFWYLLSYRASNIPYSNDRFGVLPENFEVVLNSTSQFCCDLNEDGVYNEIENDINGDGVINDDDKQNTIHHISAIEMDITSFNNSLSYTEQPHFENIHFYPNPTSSLLALNSYKEYDIEVYDMAGNKVMALKGNTIDMSHLSSATYIVKALDKVKNEEVSYKVVKN